MASTQIENLVARAEALEEALDTPKSTEEGEALGGGKPAETGFSSAYKLTAEQERILVDHAVERLRKLERDMGRSLVRNMAWSTQSGTMAAYDTFLGRRQVFEWLYENNVDWRPAVMGGIFEHSNLVVPITRRIVRQMIARAQKYFIGTDPWFATFPQGPADRDICDKVEKYARWKFDKTKLKEAIAMILQMAFVRGECVVKTTFQKKENIFQRKAKVLVDADGNDILGADGDIITDTDAFVIGQDGMTLVLQRDGVTEQPLVPIFIEKIITRKVVTHSGPTAEPIYYQDFICPLNATSIDDADFCAHLYDAPVMELTDFYSKSPKEETPEAELARLTAAIEQIRLGAGESGMAKSATGQARVERGETQLSPDDTNPKMEIAECYIRYDANNDGILEEIVLMLDVQNRRALYYDYLANVTPDGKRPFTAVRINPVDGRWYGLGAVEQFKTSQDFVDLTINRLNFAQGASGRVTFWRPDATFEGSANPNLILNTGGTYTLRPGFSAPDALTYVNLPETKNNDLNFMLNYFTQIVQLESGVVNGGDQEFSGLPSSKLATGIRSIDQAGSEMFSQYLLSLESPLTQIINRLMTILLDNLDKQEAFTYLEGDAASLISVTPDDVRGMDLNIKLLLTRYHGEQQLQSNAQAANLVAQFYGLPPEVQQKVGLFYRQSLKALGIMEADSIIQAFEPPPAVNGITPDGRVFGQAGSPGSPTSSVGGSRQVPMEAGPAGGPNPGNGTSL
jgi:hypothetical protein